MYHTVHQRSFLLDDYGPTNEGHFPFGEALLWARFYFRVSVRALNLFELFFPRINV